MGKSAALLAIDVASFLLPLKLEDDASAKVQCCLLQVDESSNNFKRYIEI